MATKHLARSLFLFWNLTRSQGAAGLKFPKRYLNFGNATSLFTNSSNLQYTILFKGTVAFYRNEGFIFFLHFGQLFAELCLVFCLLAY
jgi:hypothetical protein